MKFVLIFFCSLLGIAAELSQPYLIKIAIDDHLAIGNTELRFLIYIAVLYLVLSIISFIFTYIQNNLLQFTGQSIVASLRRDLFKHITRMSMSFFDRRHSGSLVTNVSSDTETISQFFTQVLLSLIRDGMMLIMILFFMFQLDVTLAAYSLAVLPVIAIVAVLFRNYLKETYQQARTRLSRLVAFIAENLSGMFLIQAFHQEKEQLKQFNKQNESYYSANIRQVRSNVIFNRTFDILGNIALVLMVWLGGRLCSANLLKSVCCTPLSAISVSFFSRLTKLRCNGIRSSPPPFPWKEYGAFSVQSPKFQIRRMWMP